MTLEQGRESFDRRAWGDAYASLSGADQEGILQPDDLERLALAAYLTGRDQESTDAWTRAHRAFLEVGEHERAVRCAFWLAFGLIQRGDMAQGGGWLARAQRILDEGKHDWAVRGYLLLPVALHQLFEGDHAEALATFGHVAEVGARFDDRDLQALGRIGQGQALLRQGERARGCALFDEAMVSVTTGEVSAVVSGIVYCAVVDECQQNFDVRRAREWTAALSRWCDSQPGLVPYRGQCMVHRSQVMQLRGDWREAMDEARRARERLSEPPHPAIGMAFYQLGELHRLQGDFTEAEAAYRRANELGRQPQPGFALLRLAQGRLDAATTAIEGALADAGDQVIRTQMLSAYVEIMLAADHLEAAHQGCDELVTVAAATDVPLLAAQAAHARGAVLLAEGDARGALDALRAACKLWRELDAPYHAARSRILMARACRTLGDDDTEELETAAARSVFEDLGAGPDLARIDRQAGRARAAPAGLTTRELQVVALVAAGRTNRQIADVLVISEKTVARHLSNIFTKIGVSSRSAATAYAYENGLV